MQPREPSRTAHSAAVHRAAHQVIEHGRIFSDELALRILGKSPEEIARDAVDHPQRGAMRFFIAARTRFAEDALTKAVGRGVQQLVVLGAGLDTFAYRNQQDELRVFEVDRPGTQKWKQKRLAEAAITQPPSLTFVPVDFERESLTAALAEGGFDPGRPAFFTWLGVVPYLTEDAIFETLAMIGTLPQGTQVVFDYGDPPSSRSLARQAEHEARAARVAALGEPWLTFFEPLLLAARLRDLGFCEIQDLGPQQIVQRYLPDRREPRRLDRGGHIILAERVRKSLNRPVSGQS